MGGKYKNKARSKKSRENINIHSFPSHLVSQIDEYELKKERGKLTSDAKMRLKKLQDQLESIQSQRKRLKLPPFVITRGKSDRHQVIKYEQIKEPNSPCPFNNSSCSETEEKLPSPPPSPPLSPQQPQLHIIANHTVATTISGNAGDKHPFIDNTNYRKNLPPSSTPGETEREKMDFEISQFLSTI